MTSSVFYRKWRPQTLAEVVGQEPVTQTLRNALNSGHVSHAYLFCGPRGTGKTSTGRILAKAVNCLTGDPGEPCNKCDLCQAITGGSALDIVEIDAASNRGIDDIRELRERVNYAPGQARYKVYIIDEVHMLTKEAANALLKTLEEPPEHVIFVLATTEAHKVLPTLQSRCQRFDFRRLSLSDIVAKLTHICTAEGIDIEPEGLRIIARSATGSLRDAENLLEQLTTYYGDHIELPQVRNLLGISGDWRARELVKHIVNNDLAEGIATVNSINNDGLDLRQFNRELVAYLRGLLLVKTGTKEVDGFTPDEITELKKLAPKTTLPQIMTAVRVFGRLDFIDYSPLPLELALVDCALTEASTTAPAKPKTAVVTSAIPPKAPPQSKKTTPAAKPADTTPAPLPKEPAPPPETKPTPVLPAGNELAALRQNWKQLINQAPPQISKTPAAALLRSARPVSLEDNVLLLSFRFPLHKEHMERPDNQKIAAQIISGFLGRPCRVRCLHQPEANHLVEAALKMGAQIAKVEEK